MRNLLRLGIPKDAGFKLGLFMTALQGISTLALMATSAFLISYSSEQPPILYLMLAVVGVRAFALGRAVFRYAERWFMHNSVFKMMSELRPKLFKALVPLAPGGLRKIRSGDQLTRFNADVENLQNLSLRVVGPVFQSFLALVIATIFLLFINVGSAISIFIVGLGAIMVALVVSYLVGNRSNLARANLVAELENRLVEYFQQREVLAAFGWEQKKRSEIETLGQKLQRIETKNALSTGISTSVFSLLSVVGTVLVAIPAAIAVEQDQLAGSLLAVVILLPLALFDVFTNLQPASGFFQRYLASARRVDELINQEVPTELAPTSGKEELPSVETLEFDAVELRYPFSEEVIEDIFFNQRRGEWVAIQGPSGIGKTTVALALVGLLNPSSGEIKVNGKDIANYSHDSLRRKIGLIEQQPHVFAGTVRQNLAIASDLLTDEQMVQALEEVGLWRMLSEREGLETALGERGQGLSGGEIQRLSIARALLADFHLLILDEPTSSLDRQSALELMSVLEKLNKFGKTLITITHDSEIAAFADKVLWLSPPEHSKAASAS